MKSFLLIFGVAAFALTGAEVVQFQPCTNTQNDCTINELRINPCPEAAKGKTCRIKKGINASIEFDYTTNFDADKLMAQASWNGISFPGMNTNGCAFTTCPVPANIKQTYEMTLLINKYYPSATYDIKWELKNQQQLRQKCCFILSIKLHR